MLELINMSCLPEFIKYRAQCTFALGITLITPLAAILLRYLSFDLTSELSYDFLIGVCTFDLLLAFCGFKIIMYTHHYLLIEEETYVKLHN